MLFSEFLGSKLPQKVKDEVVDYLKLTTIDDLDVQEGEVIGDTLHLDSFEIRIERNIGRIELYVKLRQRTICVITITDGRDGDVSIVYNSHAHGTERVKYQRGEIRSVY